MGSIRRASQRTREAGSARIVFRVDRTGEWASSCDERERGVGSRLAMAVAGVVARHMDVRHLAGEGVIDFARSRYMVDFGSYAMLGDGDHEWAGRSGRRVAILRERRPRWLTPTGLVCLLDRMCDAREDGTQVVGGRECQRFRVTVDITDAQVELLGATEVLSASVCADDAYVREIGATVSGRETRLELSQFGVPLDIYDWSRLPTWRTV